MTSECFSEGVSLLGVGLKQGGRFRSTLSLRAGCWMTRMLQWRRL